MLIAPSFGAGEGGAVKILINLPDVTVCYFLSTLPDKGEKKRKGKEKKYCCKERNIKYDSATLHTFMKILKKKEKYTREMEILVFGLM